ncbi:MAG: DUF4270 family protein [Chitinophagaceae bacterium]|nr:DUF4270 family protein [Chitinophagaceae bacterium]
MPLGSISNDPLLVLTHASIFMQLKPPFYRFYFGDPGDTIVGLDSIVLCLKYRGFYGDSLIPVHLEVREVNDFQFGIDSVYKENTTAYQPNVMGTILASANIDVRTLGNYISLITAEIRSLTRSALKCPPVGQVLFNRDSTVGNTLNNAFYSDSIFRRFYNGIAVIGGGGGNGLIYTNLSDTATKIEIHYRKKTAGKIDSVYSSFRLNPSWEDAANKPVSNTVIILTAPGPVTR